MTWGSDAWKLERDSYLREWIGNEDAFQFLMTVSDITELYDDLIDKDVDIEPDRVHQVMAMALIGLPSNPFYLKHRIWLTPIMASSINSWRDATELEQGTRNERVVAYVIRNLDIQLIQAIIQITRGPEFLRTVSPQLWKMFAAEQDDFVAWVDGETT